MLDFHSELDIDTGELLLSVLSLRKLPNTLYFLYIAELELTVVSTVMMTCSISLNESDEVCLCREVED